MSKKEALEDVSKTVQFALEIEKLKSVLRKVRPIWEERYENTAEHSRQIALFALSMASALDRTIDVTPRGGDVACARSGRDRRG